MPADPSVAYCLQRIGRGAARWDTIVVSGAADTTTSAEDLWAVWADLERWPLWSPLHRSAAWTSAARLTAGATVDQRISLGFPVGTTTEHVTISLGGPPVEPPVPGRRRRPSPHRDSRPDRTAVPKP